MQRVPAFQLIVSGGLLVGPVFGIRVYVSKMFLGACWWFSSWLSCVRVSRSICPFRKGGGREEGMLGVAEEGRGRRYICLPP